MNGGRRCSGQLANVHVDVDGEEEDGDEREVDDGVDEYGDAAGVEAAELDEAAVAGHLEQKPWRQDDEQDHRYEYRPPIRHYRFSDPLSSSSGLLFFFLLCLIPCNSNNRCRLMGMRSPIRFI